ncbi:T9SS type A sorting domain-containing protein [Chryseobacterium jejuense]|uniref:Por secretion system C-terminal sorting domain-containing protein n=1 Tax=Chryseobacterium jejuense TaxID=445960 RepID=A0A2X2WSG1_CHRJE|nr:T9SS type A sorting domain-containing protein [Chryseobacterium jejuense]SDJ54871.1 Por secretion system C-terminal sorting domain-containing protein [Chryseobacterium jejuense]SQB46242.1 Predicted neuraminidase (sialidase) [Chryseobacterium jejuense]
MKLYPIAAALLCMNMYAQQQNKPQANQKHLQELYLKYEKDIKKARKNSKLMGTPPDLYNEEDYKRTMDPITGNVNFEKLAKVNKDILMGQYKAAQPMSFIAGNQGSAAGKIINEPWIERGPYNVGGRTRAIMYDPNDPTGKRVFAGGVSGGLWVNQDPSVSTNEWQPLSTFWANTSVVCITYDPTNPQTFYIGTGESSTSDVVGSGIWKTTDGGATWTQIFTVPVTYASNGVRNGNFYINDIKVRNNNGVSEIYAGVSGSYVGISFNDGWQGLSQAGLYKSVDGGATFTKNANLLAMNATTNVVSTTGYSIQQIEIAADNSIWLSTRSSRFSNIDSGGRIFKSTDGNTFNQVYNVGNTGSRVNFTLSKTDANKAYAFMQGVGTAEPIRIVKTIDGGTTWQSTSDVPQVIKLPKATDTSIPANDFTRGQSFYDLVITADPLNDNTLYIGGIDLFKSTDGGTNWTQISKWSNNNAMANLAVSTVHADQHAIVFNPFNNYNTGQMMFGNDGGIFFAANKESIGAVGGMVARNTRYNVTQFYGAVLNPTKTPANEELLAGAQDNGSWWLYGLPQPNNFLTLAAATGGDGMYPEYDDQDLYEISSYTNNSHYLLNSTPNANYLISTSANRSLGHFVNEIALDRMNDVFYSYRSGLTLFKTAGLSSTATTFTNDQINVGTAQSGEQVSWLKISPHTTASSTLFVGTNLGRLFKITNANTPSYTSTVLTSPAAGTISDIEFGANENEILLTLSNYNQISVFYSTDGGTSWQNKEGNLPDMPVRTILRNPDDPNEVLVGTELGVWGTANFLSGAPTWSSVTGNIGNVRVTSLDYRPSTKTVLVSTYGRGAWTTQNTNTSLATSETSAVSPRTMNRVYPNPSKGIARLRFNNTNHSSVDISIFDKAGRLVYSKKNVKSDEEFGQKMIPGTYILKAEDKGEIVFSGNFLVIGRTGGDDD